MSSARRNTKKALTQQDKRSFYLVANDVFFGLVFAKKQSYYYKLNRNLVTSPSFTFYDNQTKAIIDYSNSKNSDDLSYVLSFFGNMINGETFAFSNAFYLNNKNEVSSDLSGVYTFKGIEQGKVIKSEIVTVTKNDTSSDFYVSKYFTKTPQISKIGSVGNTQQKNNIIKNTIPNGLYSFTRMGVRVDDYVEFSGTSSNEKKKFKIVDIFTDTDGFECIQVDSEVQDENLIGSSVLVNLYLPGEPKGTIDVTNKTYGSCITIAGITASSCSPCQNESLCLERGLINSSQVAYFENATCDEAIVSQSQQQIINPIIATATTGGITGNTVYLESEIFRTFTRPKINLINVSVKIRNNKLINSETQNDEFTVTGGITLKLSLADTSLKSYNFDFYENAETNKNSLSTNYTVVRSGKPGTVGSYISIKVPTNKNVVYLKTTSISPYVFKININ